MNGQSDKLIIDESGNVEYFNHLKCKEYLDSFNKQHENISLEPSDFESIIEDLNNELPHIIEIFVLKNTLMKSFNSKSAEKQSFQLLYEIFKDQVKHLAKNRINGYSFSKSIETKIELRTKNQSEPSFASYLEYLKDFIELYKLTKQDHLKSILYRVFATVENEIKNKSVIKEYEFQELFIKHLYDQSMEIDMLSKETDELCTEIFIDSFKSRSNNKNIEKMNGEMQQFDIKKCHTRLLNLLDRGKINIQRKHIRMYPILKKVAEQLGPRMSSLELDNLMSQICFFENTYHPDHEILAARILVSRLHKLRGKNFLSKMKLCYENENKKMQVKFPLISEELYNFVQKNSAQLQDIIDYERDYDIRYFGLRTLMRSYLLKEGGFKSNEMNLIETRQDALLRHSIFKYLHFDDALERIKKDYDMLSLDGGRYTPATPSLQNAGTNSPQMASCFLMEVYEDDSDAIMETIKYMALISKSAGGVGAGWSRVRSKGRVIKKTNGNSAGTGPFLRIANETMRAFDQGGGKRKGAGAQYLDIWHSDILNFLELRGEGDDSRRCNDLYYGIMTQNLFWERCIKGEKWTLFSPDKYPKLVDLYGEDFEKYYVSLEREMENNFTQEQLSGLQIEASKLHDLIVRKRFSRGMPYILNKDEANKKSNQKNLGTINISNLCTEIIEFTSKDEIAVCNLSSISLSAHVNQETKTFDFKKLAETVEHVTESLNITIDRTSYPLPQCEYSNKKNRPIGIGCQGLADALAMVGKIYEKSKKFIAKIYAYVYIYSMKKSCEMAKKNGAPYKSYKDCPVNQGKLQFDMWERKFDIPEELQPVVEQLRKDIAIHGIYNSEVTAQMPTASSSQILANNESFEPFSSNLYKRKTNSGEFRIVNHHLIRDMQEAGVWNLETRKQLIENNGSVQHIEQLDKKLKQIYKTYFEIDSMNLIKIVAAFSPYISQSISFNRYYQTCDVELVKRDDIACYKYGLKTISYYTRVPAATKGQNFDNSTMQKFNLTLKNANNNDKEEALKSNDDKQEAGRNVQGEICTMEEGCLSCSS